MVSNSILQIAWLKRGLLARALTPIALVYWLLLTLRKAAYSFKIFTTEKFPVPIIVVGNVVLGGTGKTPLVVALVEHFRKQGLHVGVVSRGYGRSGDRTLEVLSGMPATVTGDEPALIKAKTGVPVVVAKDRREAVRQLLSSYAQTDIVICDDGLQHYALYRDIKIAVFDDRGVGNGWLLPAGLLRERWPQRPAQSVDLILHTGQTPQFAGYRSKRHLATHAMNADGNRIRLSSLRNKRVIAIAAIGNPEAFFNMLRNSGVVVASTISLPDHYSFPMGLGGIDEDISGADAVLCTEKDAVKLFSGRNAAAINLFSVPLMFTAEPDFYVALDKLVMPLISQKYSRVPFSDGH